MAKIKLNAYEALGFERQDILANRITDQQIQERYGQFLNEFSHFRNPLYTSDKKNIKTLLLELGAFILIYQDRQLPAGAGAPALYAQTYLTPGEREATYRLINKSDEIPVAPSSEWLEMHWENHPVVDLAPVQVEQAQLPPEARSDSLDFDGSRSSSRQKPAAKPNHLGPIIATTVAGATILVGALALKKQADQPEKAAPPAKVKVDKMSKPKKPQEKTKGKPDEGRTR